MSPDDRRPAGQAELVVSFNAVPTARRLAQAKQSLIFRLISAVVSLGIVLAIYYFAAQGWSPAMIWGLFAVWGAVTLVWLVLSLVALFTARRDLHRIGTGAAVTLSPSGIRVLDRSFAWDEVAALKATGSSVGAGPKLVVEPYSGEPASVPLSFLDTLPGTLDSAARAYSLGRHGLDLSGLDAMF